MDSIQYVCRSNKNGPSSPRPTMNTALRRRDLVFRVTTFSALSKFEAPSGFSFAPVRLFFHLIDSIICNTSEQPPSVASIPQASYTPSVHDEPPISALPFTFSKVQMPSVPSPAPTPVAPAPQPPAIALVPPTPDRPLAEGPLSEPALPNFFAVYFTHPTLLHNYRSC